MVKAVASKCVLVAAAVADVPDADVPGAGHVEAGGALAALAAQVAQALAERRQTVAAVLREHEAAGACRAQPVVVLETGLDVAEAVGLVVGEVEALGTGGAGVGPAVPLQAPAVEPDAAEGVGAEAVPGRADDAARGAATRSIALDATAAAKPRGRLRNPH